MVLVNNADISSYNAKLLTKDIQTANVTTFDDWLRNALNPLYMGKQEQYKQIKLTLYVKDTSEENALEDISSLVKQFEQCTIKFDDLSFYYDCLIVNKSHTRVAKGVYNLSVELKSGYAYNSEISIPANRVSSISFTASGNLDAPAVVEITPSTDLTSLTVTGMGEDFTISNLTANSTVIIDGEAGTVLQGGVNKFADFDGWGFPKLIPGENVISFSDASADVNIKYKPRWI